MQTCDSLDIKKYTSGEDIINRFTYVDDLGSGSSGMVFKVIDNYTNEICSMKYIPEPPFEKNEIKNSCKLLGTLPYTKSVLIPKYWARMDGTFDGSNKEFVIRKYRESEIFIFPLLNYTLGTLIRSYYKDIGRNLISEPYVFSPLLSTIVPEGITLTDFKSIMFELYTAIHVINSNKISHGDLSMGNVMITKTPIPRVYNINNKIYKITSEFLPVIIDFGESMEIVPVTKFSPGYKNLRSRNADFAIYYWTRHIFTLFNITDEAPLITDPFYDEFSINKLTHGDYTFFSAMKIDIIV